MTAKAKRLLITGSVFAAVVLLDQSGLSLSYSRTLSSTSYSGQTNLAGADTNRTLTVDYPWTRWIPLVKFGETVITEKYHATHDRDRVLLESTTRADVWAFGLVSTREYETMARKSFESQSSKRGLTARH